MRVLVVEKEAALARLYREELEDAGFRVCVCGGLGEAINFMNRREIDVLVTDENSCFFGHPSWLPKVRSVHSGPVVMLAAGDEVFCKEAGLSTLPKTSDLGPLIRSLRNHSLWPQWGGRTKGTA